MSRAPHFAVVRVPAGPSFRFRPRALVVAAVCLAVALGTGVLLIGSGDFPMSPAQVVRTLLGQGSPADSLIVNQIRLPRVAAALAVGAALGLAGAIFQSLVRNPLGSPDILGFSQGAATGVLAVIVLTGGGSAAVAAGAAGGGLLTGLLVYAVAGRHGAHGQRLILVGIGVAAILTGVNGYLLTQAQIVDAARAVLWLTGSLDGRDWADAAPVIAALAVLGPLVLVGCGRALRMLEMGDDAAHGLGVPIERVRLVMLAAAVLLTSLAAAAAGPVAFVALTAPQLARRLTRTAGPNLLPAACMGAALMVAADWTAQRAFPGHQLPVGVVTGLLGGGYLVWLLVTERKTGRI
ncbi:MULTISPECIES: FecCD family ABC transporter permease [Actinomadura]|uniref:Iron complex transport system permease protein n=1 Tax=Actinomadura madurae TaxID=1993 RepID=A0A1I4WQX1_9ACTN|nr:iron chelate uptake ABC transporter family permease subunit [Actinomadura madurae]SFN16254.1 iron complex transport system permease protein [Actinomadura madurae]SPT62991.1 Ferric enterobactin transport system permease protein fepG [Actinomadura madurae]